MRWTEQTAKRQLAKDRQIAKLGQVGKRIAGTTGRCTLAIDQETYIKTVQRNGGVQAGGKTIFDDKEFVTDMKREYEHLRVPGDQIPARRWGQTVAEGRFIGGVYHEFDYKAGTVTIDDPILGKQTIPLGEFEGVLA